MDVVGCSSDHVDPSPVVASADALLNIAFNQPVCFQDFDYSLPMPTMDSNPQWREKNLTSNTNFEDQIPDDCIDCVADCHTPSNVRDGQSDYKHGTVIVSFTSPLGTDISVYPECVSGLCCCKYYIGDIESQLKPCRFAALIHEHLVDRWVDFKDMLWGVTDGFPIVDQEVDSYECSNYNSIFDNDSMSRIDVIIKRELEEGMISFSDCKPKCVHALGAVPKASGGIRPITDCSRPLGKSINNFCESLVKDFCFKSVDNVVKMLDMGEYMSVIDIKSAYRAVPILLKHRFFMGPRRGQTLVC